MSLITELETALELDAAVVWSLVALAIALVGIGLGGCMYCFLVVPTDKNKALDGDAEERVPLVSKAHEERACAPVPHRSGGTAAEDVSGSMEVVVEQDVSGDSDRGRLRRGSSPTAFVAGPPIPPLLSSFTSSGSFGGSTGGSGSFGDTFEGSSGGLGQAPAVLCPVSEEAQVIIGEWAHGVEVTLFSHARLAPGAAPKDSGKASSRPRRIKLFLEGDRLVWRKDKIFGSRVCGIRVGDISEVRPGRSAFTGPFSELRCHEFPAKGDERYLTIRASTDAIELECGSKGERDALLGGLRIICESMVKDMRV